MCHSVNIILAIIPLCNYLICVEWKDDIRENNQALDTVVSKKEKALKMSYPVERWLIPLSPAWDRTPDHHQCLPVSTGWAWPEMKVWN